jgi:hypothetical protein
MKKIILLLFLSFFISSASYSNSKDIIIAEPIKINSAVIFHCTTKYVEETVTVYFITIHKNINPGIVLWAQNPKNIDLQISFISNLFSNKIENKYIFYHNLGGGILAKYSYSPEDIDSSIKNKKKFFIKGTILRPLDEVKKSFKVFEDVEKIFEGWTLTEFSSLSRPFSKSQLSKVENYSKSIKDLFEKQELEFKKNFEKFPNKILQEKVMSQIGLECNSPDIRKLKN